MMLLRGTIFVALGGAIGATARYWTAEFIHTFFERGFPLGTLIVNVVGSFLMGFLVIVLLQKFSHDLELRGFFLIGMLGAYTTFSTFALDSFNLFTGGKLGFALLNIMLSVILCIIAAGLGVYLGLRC
jgi:CrcB protein